MALNLRLSGHTGDGVTLDVEDGAVDLRIHGEVDDDAGAWRSLTSDEARELAAALEHYATVARFG